ncbi:MAG: hypothetical protein WCV63_05215 [Negativicutes bacterium]|jgi:hypothetical protein
MLRTKIIGNLLNKELRENKKSLLWFSIALTVVLFVITAAGNIFVKAEAPGVIQSLFFITGLFLASNSYQELKQAKSAQQYLLVPATTAEKVVAKTIAYTLGSAVLYIICLKIALLAAFFAVNSGGAQIGFGQLIAVTYSTTMNLLANWYVYVLLMAVAAFASVYFRRLALLKLVASGGVFMAIISILLMIETVVLYHGWNNVNINLSAEGNVLIQTLLGKFDFVGAIISGAIKILAIPFFWVMTWLRLRETEA